MGCHTYTVWTRYGNRRVRFSEESDSVGCLCTFPHNDGNALSVERVQSLALLGAAIVLAHAGEIGDGEITYLPDDVPPWIGRGIRQALGLAEVADAVDPSDGSEGTPSTREKGL